MNSVPPDNNVPPHEYRPTLGGLNAGLDIQNGIMEVIIQTLILVSPIIDAVNTKLFERLQSGSSTMVHSCK